MLFVVKRLFLPLQWKKNKNGTIESKRGCQIEKRKKAADSKKGCQAAKTKKRLWPTHQYKSRLRFWLGRLLRSRCRRSRRARRRHSRCRGWSLSCSSPPFTPWVVAGCRGRGWFRGRGWLQGSWVVAGCRGRAVLELRGLQLRSER